MLAGALLLGSATGAAITRAGSDPPSELAALERRVAAVERRAARLVLERNRLRAERNALEARLASQRSPRVCPSRELTTQDLTGRFSVDYPCAWHVLWEPGQKAQEPERSGLLVDWLFVARLPINRSPGGGPLADVQVADWYDDSADEEDRLPTLAQWLDRERRGFTKISSDDPISTHAGIRVRRLIGTIAADDEAVTARVFVWQYRDPVSGARHIVRAFAVESGAEIARVTERLVRSFRVLRP